MADAELSILMTLKDEATPQLQTVQKEVGETSISFARAGTQFRYAAMEITVAASAIMGVFHLMKGVTSDADAALINFTLSAVILSAQLIRLIGMLQATQISILGVKMAAWEFTLVIMAVAYLITLVATIIRTHANPTWQDMGNTINMALEPLRNMATTLMGVEATANDANNAISKLNSGIKEVKGFQFQWTSEGWMPLGSTLGGATALLAPPVTMSARSFQYGGVVPGAIGQPVPIIAHGGEQYLGAGGGGANVTNIYVAGTVVSENQLMTLVRQLSLSINRRKGITAGSTGVF